MKETETLNIFAAAHPAWLDDCPAVLAFFLN
jgi:hypothetical protein